MIQGRRLSIAQIAAVTAAALAPTTALAQTNATWVGPTTGGLYNAADNWNPTGVPLNNGDTFNAIIPTGNTITYDVDGTNTVTGLSLSSGSTLRLRRPGGNPFASVDFTVTTQAFLDGLIDADGANFTANGTQLNGDQTRVFAAGGASVTLDADGVYNTSGLIPNNNLTVLSASGTGSLLDLSSVESFNTGYDDQTSIVRVQTVSASDDGIIDLSLVGQLATPDRGEDRIDFVVDNASIDLSALQTITGAGKAGFEASNSGVINLTALTSIQGPSTTEGGAVFTIQSGGEITVGPIQQASRVSVDVTNPGSNLTMGGFSGLAQVRDMTIAVSGGAHFDGSTLRASYDTSGLFPNNVLTILSASGSGSLLDLSSVESFNAGYNDQTSIVRSQTVLASDDGVIDLSSVEQLTTPDRGEDRIDFVAENASIDLSALQTITGVGKAEFETSNNGVINLSSLTSIQGPSTTEGGAVFTIQSGGEITVGPIQQASRVSIDVTNPGSSLTIGGFSGLAQVRDTTIAISSGAHFDGSTLRASYDTSELLPNNDLTVLSASGTDSLLDLSSVESFNAGYNDQTSIVRSQTVLASDDSVIDLSSVEQLTTPDRGEDRIDFVAENSAQIDLRTLESIGGVGSTRFILSNEGRLTLGPLTSTQNVVIDMDSSGRVDAPGDLTLGLGVTVQVQVSPLDASRFDVVGEASLGGDLEIELIGGLAQRILRSYDLIVADEIVGEFGNISGNLLTISNEQALVPVLVRGDGDDPDILKLVATAPGDANLDLKVDAADLNALALNWQKNADSWQEADFNDDGIVDAGDLNLLAINWQIGVLPGSAQPSSLSFESAWQQALASASIPEPMSAMLWVVGLGAVTLTQRRGSASV